MRTIARRLLTALLVVVAVLGLAVFATVRLADVDAWRPEIARALSERLGMSVEIAGDIDLQLGRRPEVVATDIVLRQQASLDRRPIARVGAVAFEADLLGTLRKGQLVLSRARASGARIDLRRDENGAGNWLVGDRAEGAAAREARVAPIFLERVAMRDVVVTYTTAISDWTFELVLDRVEVEQPSRVDALTLSAAGSIQDRRFDLDFESVQEGGTGGILGARGAVEMQATARIEGLDLEVAGHVVDPRGRARVDLALSAWLEDVADLRGLVRVHERIDLEGLGSARARARLVGGAGRVRLDDVTLEIDGAEGETLRAEGRIGDLVRIRDIELALALETDALGAVPPRLGLPTVDADSGSGRAVLRGSWPSLAFEELDVEGLHAVGAPLRLRGRVDLQDRVWSADLSFSVVAARIAETLQMVSELVESTRRGKPPLQIGRPDDPLQKTIAQIGPVEVEGRLVGEARSWRIEELKGEAGGEGDNRMRAEGRIGALVPVPAEVEVAIEGASDGFEALARSADIPIYALEQMRMSGTVTGEAQRMVLVGMEMILSTPEAITVGLNGDLPLAENWADTQLLVGVSARDLRAVGDVFDRPLPRLGPVAFSANVRAEGQALMVEAMQLGVGSTMITGAVRAEQGPERPLVVADLASRQLDLVDLGLARKREEEPTPARTGPTRPLLDRPIPFADLAMVDGDLRLRADRVVGRGGLSAGDVTLRASVRDGALSVEDLGLEFERAIVNVSLEVDGASDPPRVALRVHGDGMDVARVVAQLTAEQAATGLMQLIVDLEASGTTLRELGRTLDGDLVLYGRDGGLAMRYSRALQIDIGPRAQARSESGELERVECLIVDVSATSGLVSLETVLLDTEDKQVVGSGDIDLRSETLEIGLTPVLKSTLTASVGAAIRVHGPISDPTVTPAPLSMASTAAQGLVDRALSPVRRVFPGVGEAVDEVRRSADRAMEGAGVPLPETGLWRPGIDVTCEKMLGTERIEALRSGAPGRAPRDEPRLGSLQ